MNNARHLKMLARHESYINEADLFFNIHKDNQLFLSALGIYWGEGEKMGNARVGVINTDYRMLILIKNFFTQVLGIELKRLRVGLFSYKDIDLQGSIQFWSSKLDLPVSQFIKPQILPGSKRAIHRKLKYGYCSLYFSSTELSIKMQRWIDLLFKTMRV